MKRLTVFALLCFPIFLFSQQSAKEMKTVLLHIQELKITTDDYFDSTYHILNQQIENNEGVAMALWESMLGKFLFEYYNVNRYQIGQRTSIVGELPEDFKTWDEETLKSQIHSCFEKSLAEKEGLKNTPVLNYDSLFIAISNPDNANLYDYVMGCYIDICGDIISVGSTVPEISFRKILIPNTEFVNFNYPAIIGDVDMLKLLELYQEYTQYCMKQSKGRVVKTTLKRLSIVKRISHSIYFDEYMEAVLAFEKEQQGKEDYDRLCFEIGNMYYDIAEFGFMTKERNAENCALAISWMEKVIANSSDTTLIKTAKNKIDFIKEKDITLNIESYHPSNQPIIASLEYKNSDTATILIYDLQSEGFPETDRRNTEEWVKKCLKFNYFKQIQLPLITPHQYVYHQADLILPALPSGEYLILALNESVDSVLNREYFSDILDIKQIVVSDLQLLFRENSENLQFFVTNRITGNPLAKANIELAFYEGDSLFQKTNLITDKNGEAKCDIQSVGRKNFSYTILVTYKKETLQYNNYGNLKIRHWERNRQQQRPDMVTYLDRAIYRPGDTVQFKSILCKTMDSECVVLSDSSIQISCRTPNWKILDSMTLKLNDFGSVSGFFIIPKNAETGQYSISAENMASGYKYFQVEEYKRPKFKIGIDKSTNCYEINEQMEITGKVEAYSGYSLEDIQVKYQITSRVYFQTPLGRSGSGGYPIQFTYKTETGLLKTDQDGAFSINLFPNDSIFPELVKEIRYGIVVTATDITGETQETSSTLRVVKNKIEIIPDIPDEVALDQKFSYPIHTTACDGIQQPITLSYTVHRLEAPFQYYHRFDRLGNLLKLGDTTLFEKYFPDYDLYDYGNPEKWKDAGIVTSGTLNAGIDSLLTIAGTKNWKEGHYIVKFEHINVNGDTIRAEKSFRGIKKEEKSCHIYEALWIKSEQDHLFADDVLEFSIGSYCKNAKVLLEVDNQGKVVFSEWITLNKSKELIKIPMLGMTQGDISIQATLVQANEVYMVNKSHTYNGNKKKMTVELHSFRDQYLPGETVTLSLQTTDEDKKHPKTELLCAMYDASLDIFGENKYYPFHNRINSISLSSLRYSRGGRSIYLNYHRSGNYLFSYDNVKFIGISDIWNFNPWVVYANNAGGDYFSRNFDAEIFDELVLMEDSSVPGFGGGDGSDVNGTIVRHSKPMISGEQLQKSRSNGDAGLSDATSSAPELSSFRTNFAETAFFYPHLQTDEKGEVSFTFTMPESLTAWHFQAVAHTKDLKMGVLSKQFKTVKPLMVVTNPPRFFREGDTIDFSAKIVSQLEEDCRVVVNLQLLDVETGIPVRFQPDSKVVDTLTVKTNESTSWQCRFVVPKETRGITYRIMAKMIGSVVMDGVEITHSDGEEQTIPVLPNRTLVTESMPLFVGGKQTKAFVFKTMKENNSPTLENFRYTVEFTANPIWEVLLSLPYIMEYPHDCNEQIFSRLYANSVGAMVVDSRPGIKAVFAQWEKEGASALQSPLENNPELKGVLLQETPWLVEAENETQQRKNIAKLFDRDNLQKENQSALRKLKQNQNSDGGWSWFAGGRSNTFITRHILAGFGKLNRLGVNVNTDSVMINKALVFADQEQFYAYKQLKKNKDFNANSHYLSSDVSHYLYCRSLFINKKIIGNEQQEMYDFYLSQAEKNWRSQSFYNQALLAIALYHNDKIDIAKTIVKNLKSKAQHSESLGMYWKKEGLGWRWYEAPIERQALLIEAFALIGDEEESVEKMRQWLLCQKQSQHWGTTKATVEACHALLSTSAANLPATNDVILTIGDAVFDLDKTAAESGTGYFKQSWNGVEIQSDMANIHITKKSSDVAWGGAYWQYYEEQEKVKPTQGDLSVSKNLYAVVMKDGKEQLLPLNDASQFSVGDRIRVRMEIRSDRDIDFVHLKDSRASAFEPVSQLSGYRSQDGLWYYEAPRDAATHFFIDFLPRGTYVIEYTLVATQTGAFNTGAATIQSMYAPEFSANSGGGGKVKIGN